MLLLTRVMMGERYYDKRARVLLLASASMQIYYIAVDMYYDHFGRQSRGSLYCRFFAAEYEPTPGRQDSSPRHAEYAPAPPRSRHTAFASILPFTDARPAGVAARNTTPPQRTQGSQDGHVAGIKMLDADDAIARAL